MADNTILNKRINLRLTESEYSELKVKAENLNISVNKYLRTLIKKQKIIQPKISVEDAQKIIIELKKIANNSDYKIKEELQKIYQFLLEKG